MNTSTRKIRKHGLGSKVQGCAIFAVSAGVAAAATTRRLAQRLSELAMCGLVQRLPARGVYQLVIEPSERK